MTVNYGKKFEEKFKQDWNNTVGGVLIRLYDNTSGYLSISNISDYVAYKKPYFYILECKSCKGASLPLANITQYDKMKHFVGIDGVKVGVVLWLYEKDKVLYIPCETLTQLKSDKEKSVGLRHLYKYNIIEVPSVKKRIFMDSDYSCLLSADTVL